jgi:Phage tail protein
MSWVPPEATTRASALDLASTPVTFPPLDLWQVAFPTIGLMPVVGSAEMIGRGTPIGIIEYDGLGLPDVRTSDVDLPQESGIVALGDFHSARSLTFVLCVSMADGGAAWDLLRRLAGEWQARTANIPLQLCMTTGQTYVVTGRPRQFEADTSLLRLGKVTVTAVFVCTDPRLYDVVQDLATANLPAVGVGNNGLCLGTGDVALCLSTGPNALCVPATLNGEITITNEGNTDTFPRVTFFGPADRPAITNQTTGRVVSLSGTLSASDQILVDMRRHTVEVNGTPHYDRLVRADFWPLVPGENLVALSQFGTGATTAQIMWRNAWL